MSRAVLYSSQPNRCQTTQSDSDETDIRDVLVKGAVLFEDKELKWAGYQAADLHSSCMFGIRGIEAYTMIQSREPTPKNRDFNHTGNIYMRSDWSKDAGFCFIHNGTLGSGHGHADLGHFSLSVYGVPFLVDPGRYTYKEDDYFRIYLKSAPAHNTIVIDDEPFTAGLKSWEYSKAALPLHNYSIFKDGISYVETAFMAKDSRNRPYTCIRKLVYIEPSIWVIADHLIMEGSHQMKKFFHYDEGVGLQLNGQWAAAQKKGVELNMLHSPCCNLKIKSDYLSKKYNQLTNSMTVLSQHDFVDESVTVTIAAGRKLGEQGIDAERAEIYQIGQEHPLDEQTVSIYQLTQDMTKWIVILFHNENYKESYLFLVNKIIPVYGKAIVLKEIEGIWETVRLKT
ncbi:heparinase II/III domain-containing protein [Metabacillus sp. RGM 3146]|uniref:heparinase II/III domain-containing protein n=1 Tax=Metabacillus sp. RGM 3146 TaxID=3401092 RepID=UPI003B9AAFAE